MAQDNGIPAGAMCGFGSMCGPTDEEYERGQRIAFGLIEYEPFTSRKLTFEEYQKISRPDLLFGHKIYIHKTETGEELNYVYTCTYKICDLEFTVEDK